MATRLPLDSELVNLQPLFNISWQQTMIRIKDPKQSLPFYTEHFGLQLLDQYDFPQYKFTVYFLGHLAAEELSKGEWPASGTPEAHHRLFNIIGTTLELTHNYGTEDDESFRYNNGNVEPHRGFGHIAVFTNDVYAACTELEEKGVKFQKKPDEGRMKGLAFALDPDGYWIEIIKRAEGHNLSGKYNLSQTMIRIKDPKQSLPFYRDVFGLKLVGEKHFPEAKFSLYFLSNHYGVVSGELENPMNHMFHPVLELTHNHGTESDESFSYHNGNTDPRGFGHIGFLTDDLEGTVAALDKINVVFKKRPEDGNMRGIAFVLDPDGYWVELIQRNAKF